MDEIKPKRQKDVFRLLSASGPFHEYAEKLMLYGQFVGSWDIESIWYQRDGDSRKGTGEWHFAWVLGGRGVQDILYRSDAPAHQFGTTLRCYDQAMDAWHIAWMQPSSGEFAYMVGRKIGDRIVQEGAGPEPGRLNRWSFADITPNAFLWLGEVSFDQGITWFLEQEMRARRSASD